MIAHIYANLAATIATAYNIYAMLTYYHFTSWQLGGIFAQKQAFERRSNTFRTPSGFVSAHLA